MNLDRKKINFTESKINVLIHLINNLTIIVKIIACNINPNILGIPPFDVPPSIVDNFA